MSSMIHVPVSRSTNMVKRLFLVGLLLSGLCRGADSDVFFQRGVTAFEAGRYAEAMDDLNRAVSLDPGNLAANFYLGRAAFEAGDFETAVLAFERVLIIDPALPRVKAELGRSYHHLGVPALALHYYQDALASNPPSGVQDNLEVLIEQLSQTQSPHLFSGALTLSGVRDTNARISPEDDVIQTVLGDVKLDDSSVKERAFYLSASLALQYQFKRPESPFFWSASGIFYSAFYDGAHDLDLNYYALQSGPGVQFDRLALSVNARYSYLFKDYSRYVESYGGVATASYLVSRNFLVRADLLLEDREYFTAPGRDGFYARFSIGDMFLWGETRWAGEAGYERLNATDKVEAYDGFIAGGNVTHGLGRGIYLVGGYRYVHRRYDSGDQLFGDRRLEHEHSITGGVRKTFGKYVSAELTHTYTRCKSTIELYDYDRHVTSLSCTVAF